MLNKAFVFPGQGSQNVTMGKDFYEVFPVARETFHRVDEACNKSLSRLIFNGPDDDLTMTINAQPALMVVSMAVLNVITQQSKKDISLLCSYLAGHSLGEYSALCAAGSISLEDNARLLSIRSQSMQEACLPGLGSMAACLGVSLQVLEQVLIDHQALGVCEIANDNIAGQLIISGHTVVVDQVILALKNLGCKAIKLRVSSPFHCSLMKPAEAKMAATLGPVLIYQPALPVIANVTGRAMTTPLEIKQNLIAQICGRVLWRQTLDQLASLGVEEIVEIGAGRVLTGMLKKTTHQFKLTNVSNLTEFDDFMGSI